MGLARRLQIGPQQMFACFVRTSFRFAAKRPPLKLFPRAQVFGPGSQKVGTFRVQATWVTVMEPTCSRTATQLSNLKQETISGFGRSRAAFGK